MICRALDINGDWTFGKGYNDYLSANRAVAQLVNTNLLSWLNDCFFATNDGVDWANLLGSKNQLALNLAISAVILNTDNVTGIVQLQVNHDPQTRNVSIMYQITSAFSNNTILGTAKV
jgi:hypothetical protein